MTTTREAAYIHELSFGTPSEERVAPFGSTPQFSWAYAVGDNELIARRRTLDGRVDYYIVDLDGNHVVELITLPTY